MLPDIMTFFALAVQVGRDVIDALHGYWSGLGQLHIPLYGETMACDRFLYILCICILQTIHRDLTKARNMTNYGNNPF
jgi:hypothetical protein